MAEIDTGLDSSKITEGDVETHVVIPLLTEPHLLGIPRDWIKSKGYIQPITIGKGSTKVGGLIPDYLIIINSFPVAVIEVKSPKEQVETAYNEASAYAFELNRRFPHEINPCQIVIGCNGDKIKIGYWDKELSLTTTLQEMVVGSDALLNAQEFISKNGLEGFSNAIATQLKLDNFKRPSDRSGGPALRISKISQISFASQINPILSKYFSSQSSGETSDICTKAYISSNEITSYDKNLESFLKDRIATARSSGKVFLQTSKKKEQNLESSIRSFIKESPNSGRLQIITGSVGAGKSLFIRRFKNHLQPPKVKAATHWAFIDFNNTPLEVNKFEEWACGEFVRSIVEEGTKLDLTAETDQEKIFADKIHDRRAYYKRQNDAKAGNGDLEKARDIESWRIDPTISTKSISRYLQGDKGETIVIVFDNVDKKPAKEQLQIFQLAMWMKTETRAFVIIQMRDVTFEQYKSEPPLDTFKTGAVFHIIPPRFVDVVGRRLELSSEYLEKNLPDAVEFTTETGQKVKFPGSNASKYLETIYNQIFEKQKNISRLLESLSNRNVRSSLDMFMNILTSGHMTEGALGENAISGKNFFVKDYVLIRTLMRTDYRFYHDKSGFISNIFHCKNGWDRPSNFYLIEILFFLVLKSRTRGENGLQGYLSFATVSEELERKGMVASDARKACLYALEKGLIEADNLSYTEISDTTCFKATASAWIHMRFLSEEIEYLSAILYTTRLNNEDLAKSLYDEMRVENSFRKQALHKKARLVKMFFEYLEKQVADNTKLYISFDPDEITGAKYILDKVKKSIQKYEKQPLNNAYSEDILDNVEILTK